MNWLVWVVIVFFGIHMIVGWYRGLLKSVVKTGAIILSLYIAMHCYMYVGKAINKITNMEDNIANTVSENILNRIDETISTKAEQMLAIDSIPVPESIKTSLVDNNNHEIYEELGVSDFVDYIGHYVGCLIINGVSYIGTALVIYIILLLLLKGVIEFVSELPIVNGLDKVGGVILGMVRAVINIWICCIGVTIIGSSELGQYLFGMINSNVFLSAIYNNNLLLEFVTNIGKILF